MYPGIQFYYIILLQFCSFALNAQQNYPKDYFISPVEFPISLSGTFSELRANHFHSGIDIRTQGEEGKRILACADGFVSRIRISPFGFGKAVYITHPNGFTTVYAHLRGFNSAIDTWVKSEQYRLEEFDVDLFPLKGQLPVIKGEIIGYSGNSGSSQGPHLHFEVRESKTEMPVDPLLFGFPVKDFIRPVISSIQLYPEGTVSLLNGKSIPISFELAGWGPVYRFKHQDTVKIAGRFSIGLQAHDLLNGSNNKNGINRYTVYIDSVLQFDWQAETFSFSESRYINSFIDYAQYQKKGQRYIMTRIAPNNKLSMYKTAVGRGIFTIKPGSVSRVKVVISDASGNESVLRFIVKGESNDTPVKTDNSGKLIFSYLTPNNYSNKDITISIPGRSLYDSLYFSYQMTKRLPNSCSPVHHIHTPEVPLHDYIEITIMVDSMYRNLSNKLLLAVIRPGKKPSSAGGEFENGRLKAKIREFGQYTVVADTVAPVLKALNISNGKSIASQQTIRMSVSDNFSGIRTYKGTLNGKWILMDYDAKNHLLEYKRDERLLPGTNEFMLLVEDDCGNSSTYQTKLIN